MAPTNSDTIIATKAWISRVLCGGRPESELVRGRPLCRYRLTAREHAELGAMLRLHLKGRLTSSAPARLAALVCLFATETMRRREEPGQWTWDDALQDIDPQRALRDAERADLVQRGLEFWRRPLRRDAVGGRRLLHSLLFEAGIPSKLIASQSFAEFLRHCQREIDAAGATRSESMLRLVHDNAHRLPPTWQRAETVELAAELLFALQDLRKVRARQEALPQATLDALPVDLSDGTVQRLIDSLIAQKRSGSAPLRELRALCRRVLVHDGDCWRAAIAPPAEIGMMPGHLALAPPFGGQDHPDRIRLVLARIQLAIIEHDGGGRWRVRPAPGARLSLPADVPAECRLVVDGDEVATLVPPGGEELDAVPWVFAAPPGSKELAYLGSGSRAGHEGWLFVAVDPSAGAFDGPPDAAEACGPIAGTNRTLFRILSPTLWRQAGEDHAIRLRPEGGGADQPEIVFDGQAAGWRTMGERVFLGAPRVALLGRAHGGARLAWRRRGADRWSHAAPDPAEGAFDVAMIAGQEILDRRRIVVLPEGAYLRAQAVGETVTLTARGMGRRLLALQDRSDAVRQEKDGVQQLTIRDTDGRQPDLVVVTAEPGGPTLRHIVPVELSGGVFLDRNRRILARPPDSCFADLTALTARAGSGGKATLAARAVVVSGPLAGVTLTRTVDFIGELPLATVRSELRRLHSTTGERDLQLQLSVRHAGVDTTFMRVAIHDCTLNLRSPGRALLCNPAGQPSPRPGGLSAASLARPADPPVPLPDLEPGVWQLPELVKGGPWILIGTQELAGRVRPAVWPGRTTGDAAPSALAAAAQLSAQLARDAAFDHALAELAADPYGQDAPASWAFLEASLDLAATHADAVFLDVLVRVARCPDLLVVWLLQSGGIALARLAALEESLPFSWLLVPMASWDRAVAIQAASYRAVGLDPGRVLQGRLDDIAALIPSAAAGIWHAREILGLQHAHDQPPRRQIPALRRVIETLVEPDPGVAAWNAALDVVGDWQNLPETVLHGAPHVAACCTVHGLALSARAAAAIRHCRDREPDSFSRRHLAAVMLQLVA